MVLALIYVAVVSALVLRQTVPVDEEAVRKLSPAEQQRAIETLTKEPPEVQSGFSRWSIAIIRCRKKYRDKEYCDNQVYVHGKTRF